MKEGLSLLCKTGNGLAHAYVKLEIKERCIGEWGTGRRRGGGAEK